MKHENLKDKWKQLPVIHADEGYLWFSHCEKPEVMSSQDVLLADKLTDLPHVIEGWLVSGKVSYSIRCIDGVYHVHEFDWSEADSDQNDVSVPAHKFEVTGIKSIKLLQGYDRRESHVVQGMSQYIPSWQIFIGFEK